MSARDVFAICVVLALCLAVTGWRGGWLGRRGPKRVRFDTLEQQVDADFPAHRDEAMALVDSVLARARPDDRAMVWRKVLDAARGDIARLRRIVPNTLESLEKIYRLLGEPEGGAADAPGT
jgi:hypothetical protein